MKRTTRMFSTVRLALAFGLALTAAGCETLDKLNPFDQPKKPLAGNRQPVFPTGVPGVDYSTPLSQPSNANAPVDQLPPPPQSGQQR
ncbi:hypothetical protein ABLE93_04990 [Xanthobacter sp. KR7-65]|uniref:hypothetical protein n=1 Tax=Xanthobacter sp. KR7-65 TaxID=3156612 RepID=UPI0032B52702